MPARPSAAGLLEWNAAGLCRAWRPGQAGARCPVARCPTPKAAAAAARRAEAISLHCLAQIRPIDGRNCPAGARPRPQRVEWPEINYWNKNSRIMPNKSGKRLPSTGKTNAQSQR